MKKITEVDIFGTKYTIDWVSDTKELENGNIQEGITDSVYKHITISTGHKGTDFPSEDLECLLYHELVHAILNEGAYNAYSDDEPFVEWLAKNIRNLKKQGVL